MGDWELGDKRIIASCVLVHIQVPIQIQMSSMLDTYQQTGHLGAGVDDFITLKRKAVFRFHSRIDSCNNAILRNICVQQQFVLVPSVSEFYNTLYTQSFVF